MAERPEVPETSRVSKVGMTAKDTDRSVSLVGPDILHVDMVDALSEGVEELHVVDTLVLEVGGVVVEAKALVSLDRLDGALGAGDIEGDLGGMHLEAEVDVHLLKLVKNRNPAGGEIIEALLPVLLRGGRKGVDGMPDARTRETVDHGRKPFSLGAGIDELPTGLRRIDHLLRRALANAFGLAVSIDLR